MKFFVEWALWEKMTFVLGCALLLTIGAGCFKLWYSHWRIRKYTALEAAARTTVGPEMAQRKEAEREIPFGIRALERGIEVEGVWISKTNTPAPSHPSSPASSVWSEAIGPTPTRSRLGSDVPYIELSHPVLHMRDDSSYSSRARSSSRSAFDRAVSAERLPSRPSSSGTQNEFSAANLYARPVSPGSQASGTRGTHPYPPTSFRYPSSQLLPRQSQVSDSSSNWTVQDLNGGSGYNSANTSTPPSRESSAQFNEFVNQAAPARDGVTLDVSQLATAQSALVTMDRRTDLDLLQSHRLSHVAETGQLAPRAKRIGPSGEWSSMGAMTATAGLANTLSPPVTPPTSQPDCFTSHRKTPSPPKEPDPFATPVENNQTNMHVPQAQNPGTQTQIMNILTSYQHNAQHSITTHTTDLTPAPPVAVKESTRISPEHLNEPAIQPDRRSHVIRKVNSGFEILRPGTFAPPTPTSEPDDDRRQSKRLQKKRRSSKVSAFRESL